MSKKRIDQSVHTWDTIAESFHSTRRQPWDFCIQYISTIENNSLCADLACGNGRHLIPLTHQCKQTVGLDISFNLLRITAQNLKKNNSKNAMLLKADLCALPLKSAVFDHVIYIAALHNVKYRKNRIQSLKELYRTLKPNGTALVSVWSREQERFEPEHFTNKNTGEIGDIIIYWRQHNLNIPRFYHLYDKQEFEQDLINTHFQIETLQETNITSKKTPDNYYAIVRKQE